MTQILIQLTLVLLVLLMGIAIGAYLRKPSSRRTVR